jgi:hypothetical protein
MEVVIEIRAGADHEVDQAPLHQLDDAAAEAGGRERAGDGQADGRVAGRRQHLVGVDVQASESRPALNAWKPPFDELAGRRRCPSAGSSESAFPEENDLGRGPGTRALCGACTENNKSDVP